MTPIDLIELAHKAHSTTDLFDSLLWALREHFESDVAMLHVAATFPVTGGAPVSTLGFDLQRMAELPRRWPIYLSELEPVRQEALAGKPVVCVSDVFDPGRLRTKAFYRELVVPESGNESIVALLSWRDTPVASVMLGLRQRHFSMAMRAALEILVPALALAIVASPAQVDIPHMGRGLTARECEILTHVEAGMSNTEIAECLGTSTFTVRNQVGSILRKLQLDSRVELAGRGLSRYAVSHR